MDNDKLQLYYFQVTDLWKRLCEEHSILFDLTCDEYSLLLGTDVVNLESKVEEKEVVIARINGLENLRQEIIQKINEEANAEKKITSASELLILMRAFKIEQENKHLLNFNKLLINIIEKIQVQNKKNQLFINKAIHSLGSIKDQALGMKSYNTYTSSGQTMRASTPE